MNDDRIRLNSNNPKTKTVGRPSIGSDSIISRPSLFFYTMKDAYYFPHDSNAHSDEKILKLRLKFGWEGYGIYWAIIETLREQKNYKYQLNSIEALALSLGLPVDKLQVIINYCCEIKLFTNKKVSFYSPSLLRRMKRIDEIRQRLRESGRKGGLSTAKAPPKHKRKVKESKVNNTKEQPSAAEAALKEVYDSGFNIYSLIGRLRKERNWPKDLKLPDEVIIGVCEQYFKDKDNIKKKWPWFLKVLDSEIIEWMESKKQGGDVPQSIKDIMKGLVK